jgi:hypothetical protein
MAMIDSGLLSEPDLKGLTRTQMHDLITSQRRIQDAELALAKQKQEDAAKAREKAEKAADSRDRRQAETLATRYAEEAKAHEKAAMEKPVQFAHDASNIYRSGEGRSKVKEKADEMRPSPAPSRKVHNVGEFIDRITNRLFKLRMNKSLKADLDLLRECKTDLPDCKSELSGMRQELAAIIAWAEDLQKEFTTSAVRNSPRDVGAGESNGTLKIAQTH